MARDKAVRESDRETSLLNRRSYLRLAGATAASVASFSMSGAAQDDSLFLDEGFESTDYLDHFTFTYDMVGNELTTNPVKSGDRALKVAFSEGSHDGMTCRIDPVEAGLLDQPTRELYASYWVYFPDKFQTNQSGGKLPGPVNFFEDWSETDGNGDGHGGDPSTGYGWSARAGFDDADDSGVYIDSYVYHMDQSGTYGDNWAHTHVTKGEWHRITQHVKLNTTSGGSANADGVLEQWVDDKKAVDRHDMRWTNYPDKEGVDYSCTVWYGGGEPSPIDQAIYFDDLKLSTAPIPGTPPAGDDQQTSTPEDSTDSEGTVLELKTDDGTDTMDYSFTADGPVTKRYVDGSPNGAEGNDTITENADGSYTVTGAAGNGYNDSYYVDGNITAIDIQEDKWTIRYDGQEVSAAELVQGGQQNEQLPNILVVDGSNYPRSASSYTFKVSGDVQKTSEFGSVNPYDEADGGEITGRVIGGKDGFRFSGDITGFSLDGPATVRVDTDQ